MKEIAPEITERAARLLSAGRLRRERLEALPGDVRPCGEGQAYIVQDALHAQLTAAGCGAVVGHKIGCTTPVMQQYLGIPNPCAGGVFESTVRHLTGAFSYEDFLHPGVECEMAVTLGADLPPGGAPYDRETAGEAVEALMAAIEVVDDRWTDYRSMDTETLIADDFFGAGCVLGASDTDWRSQDPRSIAGTMWINGRVTGSGTGSDILGHPFEGLAWLANLMAERGLTLRAGEFVLLGSLVETQWVNRGDVVTIELEDLGGATARFD